MLNIGVILRHADPSQKQRRLAHVHDYTSYLNLCQPQDSELSVFTSHATKNLI